MTASFVSCHKFDVSVFSYIFHSLSKGWTVHQLEEIYLKIIFDFCSQFRVHNYIRLQPSFLIELDYSAFFFNFKSIAPCLLQSFYVNYVGFVVIHMHASFSRFSIFILLGKNNKSLCSLCSFLGFLTRTSSMYLLSISSS